jgi:hypothetical protein
MLVSHMRVYIPGQQHGGRSHEYMHTAALLELQYEMEVTRIFRY